VIVKPEVVARIPPSGLNSTFSTSRVSRGGVDTRVLDRPDAHGPVVARDGDEVGIAAERHE
jgi:hypothetical protein